MVGMILILKCMFHKINAESIYIFFFLLCVHLCVSSMISALHVGSIFIFSRCVHKYLFSFEFQATMIINCAKWQRVLLLIKEKKNGSSKKKSICSLLSAFPPKKNVPFKKTYLSREASLINSHVWNKKIINSKWLQMREHWCTLNYHRLSGRNVCAHLSWRWLTIYLFIIFIFSSRLHSKIHSR